MTMGLYKRIINKSLKKKGKAKPFGAIEIETLESKAWQDLKSTERHIYNTLKTFYQGDGKSFKAPFSKLKRRSGIRHGDTLDTAIRGLEEKGWIVVGRKAKHGRRKGLRVGKNEYLITAKYDVLRW